MPDPLKVAIDGRALTGRFTGDRTYWRNLLRAMARQEPDSEFQIYTRLPLDPDALPNAPNLKPRLLSAPNDRFWTLWSLPIALRQDPPDLVHIQYTAPLASLCPCPIVNTVHDISFRLFPQWFPRRHRLLLNLTVPASIRRSAKVLTVSESSRRDILRVYHTPEEKVVATPLGSPEEMAHFSACAGMSREAAQELARQKMKERLGIDAPFLLAVGVLQPRKNLTLLAEAFGSAKVRFGLPHILALAGKPGWGPNEAEMREAFLKTGAPSEALRFTGYIEDADLPWLYRAADAFAYPSLFEGFGLPPLEAMSCDVPVIVSDAPPMPEVSGDAALIVPARSVEAWIEALGRLLQDAALRDDLRMRGRERIKAYTWDRTAEITLQAYRDARK